MIWFLSQLVKTRVPRGGYHLDLSGMPVQPNQHHAAVNHPRLLSLLPWLQFAVELFLLSFGSSLPAGKLTVVENDDQVHALVQGEEPVS